MFILCEKIKDSNILYNFQNPKNKIKYIYINLNNVRISV